MWLAYEQAGVALNAKLQQFLASEAGMAALEAVPGMLTDLESQIFDRLGDHVRMVVSHARSADAGFVLNLSHLWKDLSGLPACCAFICAGAPGDAVESHGEGC